MYFKLDIYSSDQLFIFTWNLKKKVPFEEVPDLVAGRRVLLQKGYAFVAGSQASHGVYFNLKIYSVDSSVSFDNLDFLIYPCSWFPLLSHNFDLICRRPSF